MKKNVKKIQLLICFFHIFLSAANILSFARSALLFKRIPILVRSFFSTRAKMVLSLSLVIMYDMKYLFMALWVGVRGSRLKIWPSKVRFLSLIVLLNFCCMMKIFVFFSGQNTPITLWRKRC